MTTPNHASAASRPPLAMLGIFAGSVTLACFFAQAWRGLSLWDEGFLWYGVQRTLAGEVPMRDFMAYDPGRYYWSAIVMRWLGSDGIVALRASLAALQVLAVFAGLWIVGRNSPRGTGAAWLLSVAALLAAWMTPDFKGGDFATALGLLAALAFLAERPTAKRHLLAGACTGLAAVMGRNHGLYGAAGALFAVWVLGRTHKSGGATSRGMGLWGIGVVAGYLPMVLMLFFCPGFAASLWEGLRFTFEIKATNLPVPVPWPWRAHGALGVGTLVRDVVTGMFFAGVLLFGVVGAAWAARRAWRREAIEPGLLGCIALALPYAHYAFSRADTVHLAVGIFPTLLGGVLWLAQRSPLPRWLGLCGLGAATVVTVLPSQPGWQSRARHWSDTVRIGGDELRVAPESAREIRWLRGLADRFAPEGGVLVLPYWPGAYAVLRQKCPLWENYALQPRGPEFQRRQIAEIETAAPAVVVLQDFALDGREELRFRNTHPLLNQFIHERFRPLGELGAPPNIEVLVPRRSHSP